MNKKLLIDSILPVASKEDMTIAIGVLITKMNEDAKQAAKQDSIHRMVKDIWLKLQSDVFDAGLEVEFCDFFLEYPEYNFIEIDREFRKEWVI